MENNFIKPEPKLGESLEEYGKRVLQENCKHEKGYITNTSEDSKCIQCGKPWMQCESEKTTKQC